eukprot:530566-Prorocentrum_minimum.AAC.1
MLTRRLTAVGGVGGRRLRRHREESQDDKQKLYEELVPDRLHLLATVRFVFDPGGGGRPHVQPEGLQSTAGAAPREDASTAAGKPCV